jgi:hypothetical protein
LACEGERRSWRYTDGDTPVELCAGRAGAVPGDTRGAEGGRRAGAGREDAAPGGARPTRYPLRVAARRTEWGDRPQARRVQAAGEARARPRGERRWLLPSANGSGVGRTD